jgi:RNA polymerase sigma-70 factor, ECF subfamily
MSTATVSGRSKFVDSDFERLYREHAVLVYRTAYGVLGSPEDAEDVLQTVFLKLLRMECSPDLEKNPKAYLYRAAINLSLDVLAARRRRPHLIDAAQLYEIQASVDDPACKRERHQLLYQAIAKLSPETAEIFALRYVHDASDAEIAKMLGVSRTVIAVRLFRARARLKRLIRRSLGGRS